MSLENLSLISFLRLEETSTSPLSIWKCALPCTLVHTGLRWKCLVAVFGIELLIAVFQKIYPSNRPKQ